MQKSRSNESLVVILGAGILLVSWAFGSFPNEPIAFIILFCFIGFPSAFSIEISLSLFNQFMKDSLCEFFNSVSGFGVQGKLITSR